MKTRLAKLSIILIMTIALVIIVFSTYNKYIEESNVQITESEENFEGEYNIENQERIYKEDIDVQLSNSTAPAGTYVHNTFVVTNQDEIDISKNWAKDNENGLIYMKITSYEKYLKVKEDLSNIRKMEKEDFINYFMLVIINKDTTYCPKFRKVEYNKIEGIAKVLIYKEVQNNNECEYNGAWIIMPNNKEQFDINIKYLD